MHIIWNEFEFQRDRTTDYGVSCPWASKKFPIDLLWETGVSMLACSFLIESSSKLLVTRTGIKAQLSSILGRIRPLILELLALEWRKFHTFKLEYLWSQLVNLDQILCVASLVFILLWKRDFIMSLSGDKYKDVKVLRLRNFSTLCLSNCPVCEQHLYLCVSKS